MPIPGDPLPISPALWTDTKSGRPTDGFYQYIFKLDAFVGTNIAQLITQLAQLVAKVGQIITSQIVLLTTLTASGSVSLDDTVDITSTYDLYMIELIDLLPATNGDLLVLQFQISASFQSTNYATLLTGGFTPGTGGTGSANDGFASTNGVWLGPNGGTNFNAIDNTKSGLSGLIWLHSPNSAVHKKVTGSVTWESAGGNNMNTGTVGGTYTGGTGIVTGLRFKFTAGNITSGKVKIWGVKT